MIQKIKFIDYINDCNNDSLPRQSSRRNFSTLKNFDLSHHRTYGSVYGGFKFTL